jgi:hypothetical protein
MGVYSCGVRKAKTFHQDTYAVSTQFTDVTPPNGLNGVVARPKRFELLTPDSRLVPVSEIRSILISDFCSGSNSEVRARNSAVRFTLKIRHHQPGLSGPKSANKRHTP